MKTDTMSIVRNGEVRVIRVMAKKMRLALLCVLPWLFCVAWCGSLGNELDALLKELDPAPADVKSSGKGGSSTIKEDGTLQEPPKIAVLPETVGGVPRKYLEMERKDAPVLNIKIDEIVLSGDRVSITGSFVATNIPPMRQVTLLPGGLRRSLSLAVLTSAEVENPFRLVANDEFIVATLLPVDQQFVRSDLLLGWNCSDRFTFSFDGFPSASKVKSNQTRMTIISRIPEKTKVRYYLRSFIEARFSDLNYEYPNKEWTDVNIQGEGVCIMKIKSRIMRK